MKLVATLKKSEVSKLLENLAAKKAQQTWWAKMGKKYNFDPLKRYALDFTNGGIYKVPHGMSAADVLNKARKERKQKEVI